MRFITIHASATFPSMDIGVAEIRDWHLAKGWHDIGYHEVIRRDGTTEFGRPAHVQGAHVLNFNPDNYGICMVGGLKEGTRTPEDNFTIEQYDTLWKRMLVLHTKWPEAQIVGHNFFPGHENRGCPCFDWRKWRDEFLADVNDPAGPWPDEVDYGETS